MLKLCDLKCSKAQFKVFRFQLDNRYFWIEHKFLFNVVQQDYFTVAVIWVKMLFLYQTVDVDQLMDHNVLIVTLGILIERILL